MRSILEAIMQDEGASVELGSGWPVLLLSDTDKRIVLLGTHSITISSQWPPIMHDDALMRTGWSSPGHIHQTHVTHNATNNPASAKKNRPA